MVKMLNNMWKIKSIVKADGKNWPGRKENATASSAEGWEEEADWGGAQLQSQGVLFAYFEVFFDYFWKIWNLNISVATEAPREAWFRSSLARGPTS